MSPGRRQSRVRRILDLLEVRTFTVVDVGARGGLHRRWAVLGDRLRSIEFEPGEPGAPGGDAHRVVLPVGISDEPGIAILYMTRAARNSSCRRPLAAVVNGFPDASRFDIVDERQIRVDTLDNALRDSPFAPDFLKIDVQGHELAVLQGGRETLRRIAGVEIEAAFRPLYDGQPRFSQVDEYLGAAGFRLADLRPAYWKRTVDPMRGRGELVFSDALYVTDGVTDVNCRRLLLVAIAYEKYDVALFLCSHLPAGVQDRVRSEILALGTPSWVPRRLRHAGRLALWLDRISNELKARQWARYDEWA